MRIKQWLCPNRFWTLISVREHTVYTSTPVYLLKLRKVFQCLLCRPFTYRVSYRSLTLSQNAANSATPHLMLRWSILFLFTSTGS